MRLGRSVWLRQEVGVLQALAPARALDNCSECPDSSLIRLEVRCRSPYWAS